MALFDREITKSFFSEIANSESGCYFCEKEILEKRNKKFSVDEIAKELREVRERICNHRVMSINNSGRNICICKSCLEKALEDIKSRSCSRKNDEVKEVEKEQGQPEAKEVKTKKGSAKKEKK